MMAANSKSTLANPSCGDALRAAIGAIERLENVVRLLLSSKPVRDVPETYGEAAWAKKLIDAALRATPPTAKPSSEPVAYRWKWDKNLEWHYGEYLSQRDYYKSEPLYNVPQSVVNDKQADVCNDRQEQATPRTDHFVSIRRFEDGQEPLDAWARFARQLERELAAAQSASGEPPAGYKLVCEKCGADQGDKCGWPSNCPVDRTATRKEQGD